jgi:polynucleotide 5'-hydroxyl-kinase GRC3/NOL9
MTKQMLQKALKKAGRLDVFQTALEQEGCEAMLERGAASSSACSWVLVEGIPEGAMEWMVAAEEKGAYRNTHSSSSSRGRGRGGKVVSVGSAVVGCSTGIDGLGIDRLVIPPSWARAADAITATATATATDNNDNNRNNAAKVLVCGAKGVGKSSCLRYNINRLLSRTGAVCLLDCDVGQPECAASGVVGLFVITEPILTPSHLNLRQPVLSYYYGDVTTKNSPAAFLEVVQALVDKYTQVLSDFQQGHGRKYAERDHSNDDEGDDEDEDEEEEEEEGGGKKQKRNSKGKGKSRRAGVASENAFAVLAQMQSSSSNSNRTASPFPTSLPLVVNTDGYIRYMGSEVLAGIVETVQPDTVLHLMTEKDRFLPALTRYLLPTAEATGTSSGGGGGGGGGGGTIPRGGSKLNPGGEGGGVDINSNTNNSYDERGAAVAPAPPQYNRQVRTLEVGRLTPSNISAVDLRNLRLVSYFLRHNALLRTCVYSSASSASPSSSSVSWGQAVHIRNGAIVDRNGIVATALCSEGAFGIPFSLATMRCLGSSSSSSGSGSGGGSGGGDVSAQRLPWVMNGALVGVLAASAAPAAGGYCYPPDGGIGGYNHPRAATTSGPGPRPEPCVGLGVIRHVDTQGSRLYVIIPPAPTYTSGHHHHHHHQEQEHEQEQLPQRVVLARGAVQLPMSMTYSPLMPVHCYITGESAGDGSSKMSHRNNVKRRRGGHD